MKLIASTLRRLGLAALTMLLVVSSFAAFAPSAAAETYTVNLGANNGRLAFEPNTLSVKPGDTIKWKNNKLPPHNVVFEGLAKNLSHNKMLFKPGEEFTTTIPSDLPGGEYSFYCMPHRGAGMVGKVIVEG